MAVLGFRFCARAFSSCGKQGPLFIAVHGPLTIAASLVAEHRLQTRRLGNCGSRAQLLRGMWDPPRPGLEPVSPALAGRFSTTAPPGKPCCCILSPLAMNALQTAFLSNSLLWVVLSTLPWGSKEQERYSDRLEHKPLTFFQSECLSVTLLPFLKIVLLLPPIRNYTGLPILDLLFLMCASSH